MDDPFSDTLKAVFKFHDSTTIRKFLQSQFTNEAQLEKNPNRKSRKKVHWEEEEEEDEEVKAELKKAVEKHRKNKIIEQSQPSNKVSKLQPKVEYHDTEQNVRASSTSLKSEKNFSNETDCNGDASSDILELINYFFGTQKEENSNRSVKNYSDYERQGAIPKRIANRPVESSRGCKPNKNHKAESAGTKQALESHSDDCFVNINEGYSHPFFYIVPENPSPHFSLPRGSYYVVPKSPVSSTEDLIVFHPEVGNPSKGKESRRKESVKVENPQKQNNLSREVTPKTDTHLNIGPQDVKISDFYTNLESNYDKNKIYSKENVNIDSVESTSTISLEELFFENGERNEVNDARVVQQVLNEEKMNNIMVCLSSVFPDISDNTLERYAKKYLDNDAGLARFIESERLERKIRDQFNVLLYSLPDSNIDELREKCNEFKGDETLLNAYIADVRRENKKNQRVLDLQYIFPDADPDYLRERVEEIYDDDDEISRLTYTLLESLEYPKISSDPATLERRRLWNKYVGNFNVKNYVRNVLRGGVIGRFGQNSKQHTDLVHTYLQAKYSHQTLDYLEELYRSHNNDLVKTCELLDTLGTVSPWKEAIKDIAYTEEFLKEICYVEHKREIDDYVAEMKALKEIEKVEARENDSFLSCPLCSDDELVASEMVTCPEGHLFCTNCVKMYVSVKMGDGVYKFICPLENCGTYFTLKTLENIVSETTILNIIKKQQAEEVSTANVEGLEFCPHCEFAYIPNPSDKVFKCQNTDCLVETCRKCRDKSHIPLRCEEIERPIDLEARKRIEETMTEKLVRVCPSCGKKIVRTDGCNKISCSCGAYFCYLCRQIISGYSHFNNSGCRLYTNNDQLHNADVIEAGIQARNRILQENPDIRFVHDPTKS